MSMPNALSQKLVDQVGEAMRQANARPRHQPDTPLPPPSHVTGRLPGEPADDGNRTPRSQR